MWWFEILCISITIIIITLMMYKDMNLDIERLILRHSNRGMDKLRHSLRSGYCRRAAELILTHTGTVLIGTGFPVKGQFETDGPVSAIALYKIIELLGSIPVFVCAPPLLNIMTPYYRTQYFPIEGVEESKDTAKKILKDREPSLIISIERPGVYVDGNYYNMRGDDITSKTARLDYLFTMADCPTLAFGDGGNEIGMGNVQQSLKRMSISPSVTKANELVIASVSNWGVYGVIRFLEILTAKSLFSLIDRKKIYDFLFYNGAFDGVTELVERSEDGFSWEVGEEIIKELKKVFD